jgi:DNA-directed RNA polymerase specialized sigma24 family protein
MKAPTRGPTPDDTRNEQIYNALPPLGSTEYMHRLKTASAAELPAPVLVRAYRQLRSGPVADATLERLLGYNEKYGYLTPLYKAAKRRISRHDSYGVDDLVHDTIGEIIETLAGPRGEGAEKAWVSFLRQRMEDAYRKLVGRRGERRPQLAEVVTDSETGEEIDPIDAAGVTKGPWQGSIPPSQLEWLEAFIRRTFAKIADERIRAIAFDRFSESPTPVSSNDESDTNTLARRFGVDRYKIYRWQRAAQATLLAALESQDEVDIDVSWLKPR